MAKVPMPPKLPVPKTGAKSAKAIGKQPSFGKPASAVAMPVAKGAKAAQARRARLAGKKL